MTNGKLKLKGVTPALELGLKDLEAKLDVAVEQVSKSIFDRINTVNEDCCRLDKFNRLQKVRENVDIKTLVKTFRTFFPEEFESDSVVQNTAAVPAPTVKKRATKKSVVFRKMGGEWCNMAWFRKQAPAAKVDAEKLQEWIAADEIEVDSSGKQWRVKQ